MSELEQVFQARFELLLSSGLASQASISAAKRALLEVEQHTGIQLSEALGAPLATHLAVTLMRLLQGEALQPAPDVLWQELSDHPAALELAAVLAASLEKHLGCQIAQDEVGFIALHIARIRVEAGKQSPQEGL
jgi:transcriptional regulatory protein LevR